MADEKAKILVVDDSDINRMILREILQDAYDVIQVPDGEAALHKIWEMGTKISLILLDIMMPGMDGLAVLEEMNKHPWMIESIPVIVISADQEDATLNRAFSLGTTDYIAKPFNRILVRRRAENTIRMFFNLDRTRQRLIQLEYEQSKAAFYADITKDILFDYTVSPSRLTVSKEGCRRFGLPPLMEEPRAQGRLGKIMSDEDMENLIRQMKKLTDESKRMRMEVQLIENGRKEWYRLIAKPVLRSDHPGVLKGIIGIASNINAEYERMMSLQEQTRRDSMTGLLNKGAMEETVCEILKDCDDNENYALLLLDVDNLKKVNDSKGHSAGDVYLNLVAEQMKENLRSEDLAGRIGGDEFMIFFRCNDTPDQLAQGIYDRIRDVKKECMTWNRSGEEELPFSISAGYATVQEAGKTYEALFQAADKALYEAKRNGKSHCRKLTEE